MKVSVELCSKKWASRSNIEFLQRLLKVYPSGEIDAPLREIAKKLKGAYSHATVFYHLRSLKAAGLVTVKKKHKQRMIYYVNIELMKATVNE